MSTSDGNPNTAISWIVCALLLVLVAAGIAGSYLQHQTVRAITAQQVAVEAELRKTQAELRGLRELITTLEGESRRAPQWEYKIEAPSDYAFSAEMNGYGRDGWELVAARRASSAGIMSYEMIFKRRKQ